MFKLYIICILFALHGTEANEDLKTLAKLVKERLEIAPFVVKYKVHNDMDINDKVREDLLMAKLHKDAKELGVNEALVDVFFTDQMEANKYIQYELKEQAEELDAMDEVTEEQFNNDVRGRITKINEEMLKLFKKLDSARKHPECLKIVFAQIQAELKKEHIKTASGGFRSRVPLAKLHALMRAFSHFCENSNAGSQKQHGNEGHPKHPKGVQSGPEPVKEHLRNALTKNDEN